MITACKLQSAANTVLSKPLP